MESLLGYLDTRYGGLTSYLTYIGFDPAKQSRLGDLLTSAREAN